MLPQSMNKKSQQGTYQFVQDLDDDHANDASVVSHGLQRRPSFQWLYLTLSALCGFVVAIAMVNLFPGDLVPNYSNSKLEKLLRMPTETVVFSPVDMFQQSPTQASDAAWESFLGPSIGLISLNNSKDYDLPTGSDGHVYQLSVVHQIQCLVGLSLPTFFTLAKSSLSSKYLIRKVYWGQNKGIFNVSANPPSPFIEHTNHCFDYLLQGIRCKADMSLESTTDASGNFVGWNVQHTCSKWDEVVAFMKKYKFDEAEKATDHHHHDGDDDSEH